MKIRQELLRITLVVAVLAGTPLLVEPACADEIRVEFLDVRLIQDLQHKNGTLSLLVSGTPKITMWNPQPVPPVALPHNFGTLQLWYSNMVDRGAASQALEECTRKALMAQARPERFMLAFRFVGVPLDQRTLDGNWLSINDFRHYQCQLHTRTTSSAVGVAESESAQ